MDHGFRERDGGEGMILKEVRCIHWDMEKETKQKDDKVEQVVNGRVDPWLKLRLGGGAKELQGMSLQLYQLPSMKKRGLSRGRVQSALFSLYFPQSM